MTLHYLEFTRSLTRVRFFNLGVFKIILEIFLYDDSVTKPMLILWRILKMISSVDSSIHIPFYPYVWLYYHSRTASAFYLIRVKEVVFIWHNISREEVFQSKSVICK